MCKIVCVEWNKVPFLYIIRHKYCEYSIDDDDIGTGIDAGTLDAHCELNFSWQVHKHLEGAVKDTALGLI